MSTPPTGARGVLHVVQASYGDSLILEYDNSADGDSPEFILIDGGPTSKTRIYQLPPVNRAKTNLFDTLNYLSGAKGYENKGATMKKINTVVLTHDDEDHKEGIQDLFAALLNPTEERDAWNAWLLGDELLAGTPPVAPIEHIWYNSLRNMCITMEEDPQDNWFDLQLSVYAAKVAAPKSFNDDLAKSADFNNVAVAVRDVKARVGTSQVTKGQFTLTFIGPFKDTLKGEKGATLVKELSTGKKLDLPAYTFKEEVDQTTNALSTHLKDKMRKLAKAKETAEMDSSVTNQSSIAFCASDEINHKSLLLLGDGNASIFWEQFKENGYKPLEYTVMKVMHHGSNHNNFWKTDDDPYANLDIWNTVKVPEEGKGYAYFFSGIRAEKYIISASAVDKHPNPNIATVFGIMVAAWNKNLGKTTPEPVDIYFTNDISPYVTHTLGARLKESGRDLSQTRLWRLGENESYGTVSLYTNTTSLWEKYDLSGKTFANDFYAMLVKQNPVIAKIDFDAPIKPPPKKKARKLVALSMPSAVPTIDAIHHDAIVSLAAKPIVVPRANPSLPTSQHSMIGSTAVSAHDDISSTEPYPTKQLPDFPSLLQYLVQQSCLSAGQASSVQLEAASGPGYRFFSVIALFFGAEQTPEFLSSMPCTLASSMDYLSLPDAPSQWIVTNFSAKIIDTSAIDHINPATFAGWKGIYSMTFDVSSSQSSGIQWNIPFGQMSPNQLTSPYHFQHADAINLSIIWPAYLQRMTSGKFQGVLTVPGHEYNMVGQLKILSGQATQYRFFFADSTYSTSNSKASIGDLLDLFSTQLSFSDILNPVVINGLEGVISQLTDNILLRNPGFTLQQILSSVCVKEIFADLPFDNIPSWHPFGSTNFSFDVSELHVALKDIFTLQSTSLRLQLEGDMAYGQTGDTELTIPFQLTARFTLENFMLFEVAILPGADDELSIGQLLDVVGASASLDLSRTFSGVSNVSNALSISHVVVGWTGSPIPSYATFTVSIDDWMIIPNILFVQNLSVEIQASNLSSSGPATVALGAWGTLMISDFEVDVYFNVTHDPSSPIVDITNFQISTQEKSIPLGAILAHFFEENFSAFPSTFDSLLLETGIDNFAVQAVRDANGWSVTELEIDMRVDGQLNLFENITLLLPTLDITVLYPFDTTQRTVYAALSASINIGGIATSATVILSTGVETDIALEFSSLEQPITLQTILTYFIPDLDTISIPPSLSFLLGIGIEQASLTMSLGNGKFSVSQMSVSAISTSSLSLWDELTLQSITLLFSHSKITGTTVQFNAMLLVGSASNLLVTSLLYDGPSSSITPSTQLADPGSVVTVPAGSSWTATATYDGTISVLDVLSEVSGINLRAAFANLSLSQLTKVIDINVSELNVSLTKNPSKTAFTFAAQTDWLFFSNIRFSCSKAATWSYSFGFGIQSSDQLSATFSALKPIFDVVSFSDVCLVVFNNILDPGALPPSLILPQQFNHDGTNVAFAGKLAIDGTKLGLFGKLLDYASVDIIGVIGDEYLSLSVTMKSITLFSGDMSLTGSFIMICSQETQMLPTIGIQGTAIFDFGSHVSKGPVTTSLLLFVDTSTTALGFTFKLDKWESVFGFDGLSFEGVVFSAEFPPEEFPVPSAFTVEGTVNLSVNQASFGGSVAVHFEEMNLSNSYAQGSFLGLDLKNIIRAFTDISDVPDYLDAGFGPLEFKIVPKDIVTSGGKVIKQEFLMNGSMRIEVIHFEADVDIDISKTKLLIDGHLTPIVVLHEDLFSILASPEETPPPPAGTGAGIHISLLGDDKPGAKISGKLTLLGASTDVFFSLDERGLSFAVGREWVVGGSVNGVIDKDHLSLEGGVSLSLNFDVPSFKIGSVQFGPVHIASFGANLAIKVIWNNIAWNLSVGGSFDVFGLSMSKSFTVGADLSDLKALAKFIGDEIKKAFTTDFLNALKAIVSDIKRVLGVLQDVGLSIKDTYKLITESLGVAIADAVKAVKEFFEMGWDAVAGLLQDVGEVADKVADVLKNLGCEAEELAVALGKAFGSAVKEFCGNILKDAGKAVNDVAKFFRTTFSDDAQGVVDMLLTLAYDVFDILDEICNLFDMLIDAVWKLIHGSHAKKSQEQVQADLALIMFINANKLIANPIPINNSAPAQLPNILDEYTGVNFNRQWGYTYAGKDTLPPTMVPTRDGSPSLSSFAGMLYFTDGNRDAHIDGFVTQIMSALKLPDWSVSKAQYALTNQLTTFAGLPKGNTWQVTTSQTRYESEDHNTSMMSNATLVFANGALSEDGHDVTETVMYYMCVYYNIIPPAVAERSALRTGAMQQASSQMNHGIPIPDNAALQNALVTYGASLFESHFGFAWNSTPPDIAPAGQGKSVLDATADGLEYTEDGEVDKVQGFVQSAIIDKLSLPDWVSPQATLDITSYFKSVVSIGTYGRWSSNYIDKTYDSTEPINPIKCSGVAIAFTEAQIADDGETVSIAYIFFMGVFYELVPPNQALMQALVDQLYKNLAADMDPPPIPISKPTLDALKDLLATFSRVQFKADYKVEYQGDDTKFDTRIPGTAICSLEDFHLFKADAESWVDVLFSSPHFPYFDQIPAIRADLVSKVQYLISPSSSNPSGDDFWNVTRYENSYPISPNDDETVVTLSGAIIFVNGTLGQGTSQVVASFMYFLGVAYVANVIPW